MRMFKIYFPSNLQICTYNTIGYSDHKAHQTPCLIDLMLEVSPWPPKPLFHQQQSFCSLYPQVLFIFVLFLRLHM